MGLHSMLKPSTIVWNVGKFSVAFNVMMAIMACFYNAFVDKEGHSAKIGGWSDTMKSKVLQLYFYLVSSYFLLCLSVAVSRESWSVGKIIEIFPKHTVMASVAVVHLLTYMLERVPKRPPNDVIRGICWGAHAMVMGPCFAFFGSDVCLKAGISTALAILLANFLAVSANAEFYDQIKVQVTLMYTVVSVATFLCCVHLPPLDTLSSVLVALNVFGGILLYFGVYLTNVQATIKDMAYNDVDPMYAAATIFICTLNLFFRIAFFHVVENSGMLPSMHGTKCRK